MSRGRMEDNGFVVKGVFIGFGYLKRRVRPFTDRQGWSRANTSPGLVTERVTIDKTAARERGKTGASKEKKQTNERFLC